METSPGSAPLAREEAGAEELNRLLGDLDDALTSDDDGDDPVDNLIWVSFVENAQGVPGDPEEDLRRRIRAFANLARALSHYE